MWPTLLLPALALALLPHGAPPPPTPPHRLPGWCDPSRDGACGETPLAARLFPRFHPKNTWPLSHNNDPNGPVRFRGVYHLFMQAFFPRLPGWTGMAGWAHLASRELVRWKPLPPIMVPRTTDPPPMNATSYFSGSVTVVDGVPTAMAPAVFFPPNSQPCPTWANQTLANRTLCYADYVISHPLDLDDPWLTGTLVSCARSEAGAAAERRERRVEHADNGGAARPRAAAARLGLPGPGRCLARPNHPRPLALHRRGAGRGVRRARPRAGRDHRALGKPQRSTPAEKKSCASGQILKCLVGAQGSRGGSDWSKGWDYLGVFFPGTGDARCPTPVPHHHHH